MNTDKIISAGRDLDRAFALLDRANEIVFPTTPQLVTKRGLLDEARLAVNSAKAALGA
jgi:hypothetical protein